jgi:hypothetical protein
MLRFIERCDSEHRVTLLFFFKVFTYSHACNLILVPLQLRTLLSVRVCVLHPTVLSPSFILSSFICISFKDFRIFFSNET